MSYLAGGKLVIHACHPAHLKVGYLGVLLHGLTTVQTTLGYASVSKASTHEGPQASGLHLHAWVLPAAYYDYSDPQ